MSGKSKRRLRKPEGVQQESYTLEESIDGKWRIWSPCSEWVFTFEFDDMEFAREVVDGLNEGRIAA